MRRAEEARESFDYERARELLARALVVSGGGAPPAVALLSLLVEVLGDDAAALSLEGSLSRTAFSDASVCSLLALAAARSGDEHRALRLMRSADGPLGAEVFVALGFEALRRGERGDVERAAGYLSQAQRRAAAAPGIAPLQAALPAFPRGVAEHPSGRGLVVLGGERAGGSARGSQLDLIEISPEGATCAIHPLDETDANQSSSLATDLSAGLLFVLLSNASGQRSLCAFRGECGALVLLYRVSVGSATVLLGDSAATRAVVLSVHDDGVDAVVLGDTPPRLPVRPAALPILIPGPLDAYGGDRPSGMRNAALPETVASDGGSAAEPPLSRMLGAIAVADACLSAGDAAGAIDALDHRLVWTAKEVQSLARLAEAYLHDETTRRENRARAIVALGSFYEAAQTTLADQRLEVPIPEAMWDAARLKGIAERARRWLDDEAATETSQ